MVVFGGAFFDGLLKGTKSYLEVEQLMKSLILVFIFTFIIFKVNTLKIEGAV